MKKFVTFKKSDGSRGYVTGDVSTLHAELAAKLIMSGAEPTGGGFINYEGDSTVFFGTSGSLGPFDPNAIPKR